MTKLRNVEAELLCGRGAHWLTDIHSTAWVADTATIGEGSILCPNSIVNAGANVEENVAVNVFAVSAMVPVLARRICRSKHKRQTSSCLISVKV